MLTFSQPVIDKRTYQTHIYHVVVPVREIHHNAAQYHPSSPLATVTLDQFKQAGGTLNGREERYDAFEGEPRAVSKALSGQTSFAAPATGGNPQGGLNKYARAVTPVRGAQVPLFSRSLLMAFAARQHPTRRRRPTMHPQQLLQLRSLG